MGLLREVIDKQKETSKAYKSNSTSGLFRN
jgi:hypothetical protein